LVQLRESVVRLRGYLLEDGLERGVEK
jgi:hypothetical protein